MHTVGVAAGELCGDGAAERVADGDEAFNAERVGQPDDVIDGALSCPRRSGAITRKWRASVDIAVDQFPAAVPPHPWSRTSGGRARWPGELVHEQSASLRQVDVTRASIRNLHLRAVRPARRRRGRRRAPQPLGPAGDVGSASLQAALVALEERTRARR